MRGVIHIGANDGHERDLYARHDLSVLWIEPLPNVFEDLKANIASYRKQRCVRALLADADGRELTLHVANNGGASSSILELAEHRDLWPEVCFIGDLRMDSVTLPTLMRNERIDAAGYDGLVLDTQGSELLILRGAAAMLGQFRFIRSEVADFEVYAGCARRREMAAYLGTHGFREWAVEPFASHPAGGRCYDILYRRP